MVNSPETLVYLFLAALTALSVILTYFIGRDEKPEELAVNRPPLGLTPPELGYAVDGYVDYSDILSLLLYWVAQGRVSIVKNSLGKYVLRKSRGLDADAKPYEKYLFDWVFSFGDEMQPAHFTGLNMRTVLNRARRLLARDFAAQQGRLFTPASLVLKNLLACFTALPMISSLVLTMRHTMSFSTAVIASGIVSVIFLQPEFGAISLLQRWQGWRPNARKAILTRRLALVPVSFAAFLLYYCQRSSSIAIAAAAMASTVIIGLCDAFAEKRTPRGRELLAQAQALRRFIVSVNQDEAAKLQSADDGYFFSMVPYAYIFGYLTEWAGKFQNVGLKYFPASQRIRKRNPVAFSFELQDAMHAFLSSMVYRPVRAAR